MKFFLTAGLLVATATFAAAACEAPKTNDGTSYECDGNAKTWFNGEDDISADWATTHEWQSARPGIVTDANVVTKCYGQKKTCFRVVDKGIGWNPEAGANDCKCGHERFSTARVISKKKHGEGFYELRARMGTRAEHSPFHVAFFMQGDKSEIDVVEFVNNNVAEGGKKDYFTNHHCFDKSDEDAANTKSAKEAMAAVANWPATAAKETQAWHTYGVNWQGDKLTFFLDGKKIRTATASCLVGESMTISLGHETNEEFGGVNDADNWGKAEYKEKQAAAVLEVQYLKYWKTQTAAVTTAPATTAGAATLPTNCRVLKAFSKESGKRHAYQGKNYNDPITGLVNEKGLSKEACATKCAGLPMCSYWILHSSKGCIMKYWGLPRKQVKGTAYEAHGTCEPVLDAKCEQLGASLSGDGFAARREFKTIKEAATARTPGGCSQLCAKTDGCNYWIVHNTKGCFMHKKTKKGVLKPAWKKKGFMAHGVCNNYVAAWKV